MAVPVLGAGYLVALPTGWCVTPIVLYWSSGLEISFKAFDRLTVQVHSFILPKRPWNCPHLGYDPNVVGRAGFAGFSVINGSTLADSSSSLRLVPTGGIDTGPGHC